MRLRLLLPCRESAGSWRAAGRGASNQVFPARFVGGFAHARREVVRVTVLLGFLGGFLLPATSRAGGQITSLTESNLDVALRGGGQVVFATNGVLAVTSTKVILVNTVLDATGWAVTISGGSSNRLFAVNPGITLEIKHLTLSNGASQGATGEAGGAGVDGGTGQEGAGGAIYVNGGVLRATDTSFSANSAVGGAGGPGGDGFGRGTGGKGGRGGPATGGAVCNSGGALWLTNCVFTSNTAEGGVGTDGASGGDGGSGGNGGSGGAASGGALYNTAGGALYLFNCSLSGNVAQGTPGGAGGADGGGLGQPGTAGPSGSGGGGALYNNDGEVHLVGCTFDYGSAVGANGQVGAPGPSEEAGQNGIAGGQGNGGAALNAAGTLALTNCTFFANAAQAGNGGNGGDGGSSGFGGNGGNGGKGGVANGGGICATGGSVTCVSCTFEFNVAEGGTGGLGGAGGALGNPGDKGSSGPGYGGAVANAGGSVALANALLADSLPGQNASGPIADDGNNLSSDTTPAFTSSSSRNSVDLHLGTFGDHGGPTWTVELLSASPAIDAGNGDVTLPTDQRGVARDGACDVGAYEFATPELQVKLVAGSITVSWVASGNNFLLQSTPSLPPGVWTAVTNVISAGSQHFAALPATGRSLYLRLLRNQ
jgi:hypothetical protein